MKETGNFWVRKAIKALPLWEGEFYKKEMFGLPRKTKRQLEAGLVEVKATIGHDLSGKRIQKSFYGKSKQEAQRKAKEYAVQQEVANQTGQVFVKNNCTFGEWALKWLEIYKKPKTTANGYAFTFENTVVKHLIPFFGKAELTEIRNVDVQKFFSTKLDYSDSMLGKMKMCLNGIFESAIENDLCYKNPAKNIEYRSAREKNVKHTYTEVQSEKVKVLAKESMCEIVVLLETGLRRGELLGLMWDDIDFANEVILVNRSIADSRIKGTKTTVHPPKWNSYRTVPLLPQSIEVLKNIVRKSSYVFPSTEGEPQSPNTWSQKLKRFMSGVAIKCPGIPELTAHELRHTYGTILRRKGVDIYTIQKVMGHKDIKMTTEIYVHNEIDVLKSAIQNVF